MAYIRDPALVQQDDRTDLIQQIDDTIQDALRSDEWRRAFMSFQQAQRDAKWEGIEEGRTEGFNLLGKLIDLLFEQNRLDEARKVTKDSALRDRLLKEFKLA